MGWAVGFDTTWRRDVGYGVPAICDFPGCSVEINRGLGYVCGDEPYGGEDGCGLYFCSDHGAGQSICTGHGFKDDPSYEPSRDVPQWVNWKLTDESWRQWRKENAADVAKLHQALDELLAAYVRAGG